MQAETLEFFESSTLNERLMQEFFDNYMRTLLIDRSNSRRYQLYSTIHLSSNKAYFLRNFPFLALISLPFLLIYFIICHLSLLVYPITLYPYYIYWSLIFIFCLRVVIRSFIVKKDLKNACLVIFCISSRLKWLVWSRLVRKSSHLFASDIFSLRLYL